MSTYISISSFSQLYSSYSDLLTEEGMNAFLLKLNSSEGEKIINQLGLNNEERTHFIQSLSNPKTVLFHSWIDQNTSLVELLTESKLLKFEDTSNHLKHQFSGDYKIFVSPYLANKLLSYSEEKDLGILENAFSFVQLLDGNNRAAVESQLYKSIHQNVVTVTKSCKSLTEESVLIEQIQPLCEDRIIACVNSLSRASYSYKMDYVDDLLSVIRSKACTSRFANWVLKKMELVELNSEHEYKITDLKRELKEGELRVKNHGKGRAPIKWGAISTFAIICIMGALIFWIVKFKPFSDVEDPQFANETSFMQFSKEERKKIDSLLTEMNGTLTADDLYIDQGVPLIGQSDQLIIRKTFVNPTFERIYQDLIKDAEYREDRALDSCTSKVKFQKIQGTKELSSREGDVEAMIKNESEYDALIVVAENTKKGSSFSMMIKKGETLTFKMNKYNLLMVVPGNKFQKYESPANPLEEELPSGKFTHHFCEVDFNYKESINTVYKLMNIQTGKTKFLLLGDKGSNFHLIDINSVLESL